MASARRPISPRLSSRHPARAAIPAATAQTVLEQVVREGGVVRGWLGAEYYEGSGRDFGRGAMILAVHSGSPAELAGLRPGDLLLDLDGVAISDANDLRRREADGRPGQRVVITGLRAGIPFALELDLARKPFSREV